MNSERQARHALTTDRQTAAPENIFTLAMHSATANRDQYKYDGVLQLGVLTVTTRIFFSISPRSLCRI